MKRFIITSGILLAPALLVANCSECILTKKPQDTTQTTPQTKERSSHMTFDHQTSTGLHYTIVREGHGQKPHKGQKVKVHYRGWLDNKGQQGEQFDSSIDRGTPFVFEVGKGQVIRGWDETLLDMKVGERRLVHIPAYLGYGDREIKGKIPAHSNLIFEIELLEVVQ